MIGRIVQPLICCNCVSEGIAVSYVTRLLRLTLLAPDIVEAILDGRQGPEVTLARLIEPFPLEWQAQGALDNKQ